MRTRSSLRILAEVIACVFPLLGCGNEAAGKSGGGSSSPQTMIVVSPTQLDFGKVEVNREARATVFLENVGSSDAAVRLAAVQPLAGVVFSIEGEFTMAVRSRATASVDLVFRPVAAGDFTGGLSIDADGVRLRVWLHGVAALPPPPGPRVSVSPTEIADQRGYDTGEHVFRLSVANEGDERLLFGATDDQGTWEYIAPELASDHPEAFGLELATRVALEDGLAPGDLVDFRVTTRAVIGEPRRATIRIRTNDSSNPVVEVPVFVSAAEEYLCDAEIRPPSIAIGSVEVDRYLTLSATVTNTGRRVVGACLLSGIEASDPAFLSEANGLALPIVIEPYQSVSVPIRLHGTICTSGEVRFIVENAIDPESLVLKIPVAGPPPRCMAYAPTTIDFGEVPIGCQSGRRVLVGYNTCSATVSISAADVQPAEAGFVLSGAPAMPLVVAGGAATQEMGVVFVPTSLGAQTATLRLDDGVVDACGFTGQGTNSIVLKGTGVEAGPCE